VPFAGDDQPGIGWPWRIDGPWAAAADLGPMLGGSFAFAAATSAYLYQRTGVRSIRWPLGLVAAIVGWLPFTGSRHGLIVVSGGVALAAVVIAARRWSIVPRRPLPSSRALCAGLVLAIAAALGVVSASYGALNPLAVRETEGSTVPLRQGRSAMLGFAVENRGPLTARVQGIAVVNEPQLADVAPIRIASARLDSGRAEAPTLAGLFKPFEPQRLPSGESVRVYLTLSVAACRLPGTSMDLRLRELDIRLRTVGRERTQRVRLEHDLRVRCRTTGR
jgi:hypothetical protein